MAHKIFGQRFLSRVQPAWHGLGITFPEGELVLPSDAVKRVAGDVQVVRRPLAFELDGKQRKTDHCAIVRLATKDDAEPVVLGVTSENWTPVSYPELAKHIDKIDPAVFKVETCGLLEDGALCFLALRGEDWSLLGQDEQRSYFLANFSLKPGVAHRGLHTTVRPVCWNTNTQALTSSQIQIRIPHNADAAQEIGLCMDLVARYRKAQEDTKRIFEVFARTPAPKETVEKIMIATWPEPVEPAKLRMVRGTVGVEGVEAFKRGLTPELLESLSSAEESHRKAVERARELRSAGVERFEAFKPVGLRGTVWAAYNGATEVSDWRGDGKNVGAGTLIGARAVEKTRAFGAAMEVCGLN